MPESQDVPYNIPTDPLSSQNEIGFRIQNLDIYRTILALSIIRFCFVTGSSNLYAVLERLQWWICWGNRNCDWGGIQWEHSCYGTASSQLPAVVEQSPSWIGEVVGNYSRGTIQWQYPERGLLLDGQTWRPGQFLHESDSQIAYTESHTLQQDLETRMGGRGYTLFPERIFEIYPGINLELENLEARNGNLLEWEDESTTRRNSHGYLDPSQSISAPVANRSDVIRHDSSNGPTHEVHTDSLPQVEERKCIEPIDGNNGESNVKKSRTSSPSIKLESTNTRKIIQLPSRTKPKMPLDDPMLNLSEHRMYARADLGIYGLPSPPIDHHEFFGQKSHCTNDEFYSHTVDAPPQLALGKDFPTAPNTDGKTCSLSDSTAFPFKHHRSSERTNFDNVSRYLHTNRIVERKRDMHLFMSESSPSRESSQLEPESATEPDEDFSEETDKKSDHKPNCDDDIGRSHSPSTKDIETRNDECEVASSNSVDSSRHSSFFSERPPYNLGSNSQVVSGLSRSPTPFSDYDADRERAFGSRRLVHDDTRNIRKDMERLALSSRTAAAREQEETHTLQGEPHQPIPPPSVKQGNRIAKKPRTNATLAYLNYDISQSLDDRLAVPAKTFDKFVQLPAELRLMIWGWAIENQAPRTIVLFCTRTCRIARTAVPFEMIRPELPPPNWPWKLEAAACWPPAMFRTCRESRAVARKSYKPCFAYQLGTQEGKGILFNSEKDFLLMNSGAAYNIFVRGIVVSGTEKQALKLEHDKVQNLALGNLSPQDVTDLSHSIPLFKNLKNLHLEKEFNQWFDWEDYFFHRAICEITDQTEFEINDQTRAQSVSTTVEKKYYFNRKLPCDCPVSTIAEGHTSRHIEICRRLQPPPPSSWEIESSRFQVKKVILDDLRSRTLRAQASHNVRLQDLQANSA